MKAHTLAFICLWPLLSSAQQAPLPVVGLPLEVEQDFFIPGLLILKDERPWLTRRQAWDSLQGGVFLSLENFSFPNKFHFGAHTFWMAFAVENTSEKAVDLVVSSQGMDTLWVAGQMPLCLPFPELFPRSDHLGVLPYPVKHVVTLKVLPAARDTLFFRGSTYKQHAGFMPRLIHAGAFEPYRLKRAANFNYVLFLGFGSLLSILFFAFAQYFQYRDRTFLWYGLYLTTLLFSGLQSLEGRNPNFYFSFYLFPDFWTKLFTTAAYFISYSYFIYCFIANPTPVHRFIQRVVTGFSAAMLAADVILLALGQDGLSWTLYSAYRLVIILFSFGALIFLWRQRSRTTGFLFAGSASLMACELIALFLPPGSAFFTSNIGIGLELAFFSLALADRSRLFRNKHNRLQTEHIRQLEENERLRDIARREELEAFKNRFYANITHEFRTPLTVMLGMAQELRENADPAAREAGKMVERNGRNLLSLVNQLLDLSKIESGALQLQPEQADVMQFIKVVTESFGSLAAGKKQNLSVKTEPGNFVMAFDATRLQQILGNLIDNALKYTAEGGVVAVRATLAGDVGDMLHIEVRDNGMGIPAEKLPHIFDRFYQAENGSGRHAESTGIGLALVKELVALMEGVVEVESGVGQGSVFRVLLPAPAQANAAEPASETTGATGVRVDHDHFENLALSESWKQPEDPAAQQPGKPWLLLVEDNADLTAYLSGLLASQYRLLKAANGAAGLETAFEHLPDLVLSDVMMPGMDGFEFCKTLKNDPRTSHIPVVMLTARAGMNDRIEGLQHGADAWLAKPFDRAELFATLAALLESRRRLQVYFANLAGRDAFPTGQLDDLQPLIQKEHEFLARVRACVDARLSDENYDIPQLCRNMAMSRMQLHRKLTALGSPSAALFVRAHRLARAKTLLETSDCTIAEAAFDTGFSDPAYFTRCFREAYGKPPSEWRKG